MTWWPPRTGCGWRCRGGGEGAASRVRYGLRAPPGARYGMRPRHADVGGHEPYLTRSHGAVRPCEETTVLVIAADRWVWDFRFADDGECGRVGKPTSTTARRGPGPWCAATTACGGCSAGDGMAHARDGAFRDRTEPSPRAASLLPRVHTSDAARLRPGGARGAVIGARFPPSHDRPGEMFRTRTPASSDGVQLLSSCVADTSPLRSLHIPGCGGRRGRRCAYETTLTDVLLTITVRCVCRPSACIARSQR